MADFFYPQHLRVPTVGPASPLHVADLGMSQLPSYTRVPVGANYPLTSRPLSPGTQLGVPNPLTAPRGGTLGARVAAAGGPGNLTAQHAFPHTTPSAAVADDVARAASSSSRGGARGLLGSLTSSSPLAGKGALGGALRGGAITLGGEIVANPLGNLVGGGAEDTKGFDRADVGEATAGAVRGGALGYTLGGGYGAAGGAVLGGLAGALDVFGEGGILGGLFGGNKGDNPLAEPSVKKSLNQALRYSGLDKGTQQAIKAGTLAQLDLAKTDEERAAILQQAGGAIQQSAMQQKAAQDQLAHSLALQAQAAQIFQPFAEANQRTASMAADVYGSMKQNLSPGLDAVADMFALNAQQQADAMTQGLYTTALAKPRIDALVSQQQQIDSIAAQIVQQAAATAASGGGAGGGVDIEALLASVG